MTEHHKLSGIRRDFSPNFFYLYGFFTESFSGNTAYPVASIVFKSQEKTSQTFQATKSLKGEREVSPWYKSMDVKAKETRFTRG
jgi:hypothetical protein